MNIEKTPLVTSLIRACKSGDKDDLIQVIQSIRETGISKNDVNFVDKNGRTALSYICVTSFTSVLDFLLKLQGIDVNRADNEGNTPLHFAAEAGQSEIIAMLLTRSRSLVIDAKNIFGMTPLMKAAIQGRTDCAKRLMLANASPFERDNGRHFTAKEWAHFCGRKFCSDAMGELIKKRMVAQRNQYQRKESVYREKVANMYPMANKSSDPRKDGSGIGHIASKLRNIFRQKLDTENEAPDVNASIKLEENGKCSVTTVPTVEITPANNHQLINKYKSLNAAKKSVAITDDVQALRQKSYNE